MRCLRLSVIHTRGALLGALLLACGGDDGGPLKRWDNPAAAYGLIQGWVVEVETGQPVAGADVVVSTGQRARTRADGQFEVMAPAGRARVQVESQDYVIGRREVAIGAATVPTAFKLARKAPAQRVGRQGGTVANRQAVLEIMPGSFATEASVSVTYNDRARIAASPAPPQFVDDSQIPRRVLATVAVEVSEPPAVPARMRVPVPDDATAEAVSIYRASDTGEWIEPINVNGVVEGVATFSVRGSGVFGVVVNVLKADKIRPGYVVFDKGDGKVSEGDVIAGGTEVETASRALVVVDPQGTTIEVAPASRALLEAPAQPAPAPMRAPTAAPSQMEAPLDPFAGRVRTRSGTLRFLLAKRKILAAEGVRLEVVTPNARLEATGTAFSVTSCEGVGRSVDALEVIEGAVRVRPAGEAPATVMAGRGATLCRGCTGRETPTCAPAQSGDAAPAPPLAVDGSPALPPPPAPDAAPPPPATADAAPSPAPTPDAGPAPPADGSPPGDARDDALDATDATADAGDDAGDDATVPRGGPDLGGASRSPDGGAPAGDADPAPADTDPGPAPDGPAGDTGAAPAADAEPDLGAAPDGEVDTGAPALDDAAVPPPDAPDAPPDMDVDAAVPVPPDAAPPPPDAEIDAAAPPDTAPPPDAPWPADAPEDAYVPPDAAVTGIDAPEDTFAGDAPAGVALSISPSMHDYGTAPVSATTQEVTFTVTSVGSSTAPTPAISLKGPYPGDYEIATNNCTVSLPPSASCTVGVRFRPMASGPRNADLEAAAAGAPPVLARLYGAGGATSADGGTGAMLVGMPMMLDVGSVAKGTMSPEVMFEFRNVGSDVSGPLAPVALSGSATFAITADNCGTLQLAPSMGCFVKARFSPTAAGVQMATASTGATPGGAASVSLKGTGTDGLVVMPWFLDFGPVVVNGMSGVTMFSVRNDGTMSSGTIAGATITGAHPGDFFVSGDACAGMNLPPGGMCTVGAYFKPTATGMRAAALTVQSPVSGVVSAELRGTGQ
jgi:hypothetical protein